MHPRQQIRNYVAALLKTKVGEQYPTDAGEAIYAGRDIPFGRRDFTVGVLVYTNDEDVDREQMHTEGQRRRTMRLEVQSYAMSGADDGEGNTASDRTDNLAWQIEGVMRSDPNLGGRVETCNLLRTETDFAGNADQSLWVTNLIYEVIYWTHEILPDGGTVPVLVLAGVGLEDGPPIGDDDYSQVYPCAQDDDL